MKKALLIIPLLALMLFAPAFAKTATLTISFNQAQFQWRGTSAPLGDWTYMYQNSLVTSEYKLSGNVLHTQWDYSPLVTDLEGQNTVYVYDKKADLWSEKEGQVSYKYVPGYGDYPIVNFFRGYMQFNGAPSTENFEHGVAYQWVYLYAPEDADTLPAYDVWDAKVGAWLVGFSIYLWDSGTQDYDLTTPFENPAFPSTFIEPFPANNYNPLSL